MKTACDMCIVFFTQLKSFWQVKPTRNKPQIGITIM